VRIARLKMISTASPHRIRRDRCMACPPSLCDGCWPTNRIGPRLVKPGLFMLPLAGPDTCTHLWTCGVPPCLRNPANQRFIPYRSWRDYILTPRLLIFLLIRGEPTVREGEL